MPREYFLDVGVDEACPSRDEASAELREEHGSRFGSVDGEAAATIHPARQDCCYQASFLLDGVSTEQKVCLERVASEQQPTELAACPAADDVREELTDQLVFNNTTAAGPPDVANVSVLAGPTIEKARDAFKRCAYAGTELDSMDVCG